MGERIMWKDGRWTVPDRPIPQVPFPVMTHAEALEHCTLDDLKRYAVDLS